MGILRCRWSVAVYWLDNNLWYAAKKKGVEGKGHKGIEWFICKNNEPLSTAVVSIDLGA